LFACEAVQSSLVRRGHNLTSNDSQVVMTCAYWQPHCRSSTRRAKPPTPWSVVGANGEPECHCPLLGSGHERLSAFNGTERHDGCRQIADRP